jgi:IclR family transcriptional regulator, KDG regulon repressor
VDNKGVQTLERSLDLIEYLSLEKNGSGITEVGNKLGLHKSTVHRLLNALVKRGYVEKDKQTSKYSLGLKFIEIGSLRLNHIELKTEAAPYLRHLAESTRQPVHLAILDGIEAVYIDKIEPVSNLRMYSQIGRRVPVFCSALGKSLLSDLTDDELEKTMTKIEFRNFTKMTHAAAESFRADILSTRSRGWSIDDEEHEEGIRCIGAPVKDYTGKIIAALSVSGDKNVITPERDSEISGLVINTAQTISRRMGYFVD